MKYLDKVTEAEQVAKRFLVRIKDLKQRVKQNPEFAYGNGTKESGAVRRASLDLSRALADLRK